MKEEFSTHIHQKNRAREENEKDKQAAKENPGVHTVTFDLEAVLTTPCTLVSQLYYMRKLNVYNLSIYSLSDSKGYAYVWDEVNGRRGANEIATCLYKYLMNLPNTKTHVILYSDSCRGQNKNHIVASSLLHILANSQSLQIIEHKFLVSGHTQMECDSMHSAIEKCKKVISVYAPSQWHMVISMARKNPHMLSFL